MLRHLTGSDTQRRLTESQHAILTYLSQLFVDRSTIRQAAIDALAKLFEAEPPFDRFPPLTIRPETLVSDEIDTPEKMLSVIAAQLGARKRRVPTFLSPLIDLGDGAQIGSKMSRQAKISEWQQRLAILADQRHLKEAINTDTLRLRFRLTKRRWLLEMTELGSSEFISLNSASVQNTVNEIAEAQSHHLDGASAAFLFILKRRLRSDKTPVFGLSSSSDRTMIGELLRNPNTAPLLVNERGAAITQSSAHLHWAMARDGDDVLISFVRDDGLPSPAEVVVISAVPPVYLDLVSSQWFTGHPPPNIEQERFSQALVPVESFDSPAVARFASKMKIPLPEDLAEKHSPVSLLPLLSIRSGRLKSGSKENDCARIELFAVDPSGAKQLYSSKNGWSEISLNVGGLPPFDEGLIDDTVRHFHGAFQRVEHAGKADTWLVELRNHDDAALFHKWISGLPTNVRIDASDDLAGLISETPVARLDVSVRPVGEAIDWFDIKAQLKPMDITLTPAELDVLHLERGDYVRLMRGWCRVDHDAPAALKAQMKKLGMDVTNPHSMEEPLRVHALHLSSPDYRDVLSESAWQSVSERAAALIQPADIPVPPELKAELRPYQKDGFKFLHFMSANHLGCILADDMGLGKTLQALTWLLWLKSTIKRPASFRVLIVCPKSVQSIWKTETEKFAPTLTTSELLRGPHADPVADLTIINYSQLRIKSDALKSIDWSAVILDEGQAIKNPESASAHAAFGLKARHRLVLSGTPIENRSLDIWSLFRFALPGLLGSKTQFRRLYDNGNAEARQLLRSRVRHFMLRRKKDQVAKDLPPKIEEDILCELAPVQRKMYDAELKIARAMLSTFQTKQDLNKSRFHILTSILRLRQICCHPHLVIGKKEGGKPEEENSSKLEALLEQVETIVEEGHKILIFSNFLDVIEMVSVALSKRFIGHLTLTGSTQDRGALVERFQASSAESVFLISLKAGGTGLNLTAASYVFLFDPWWNPAAEAQAIDRTHRIGQTSRVIAYRLIAKHTIEEKIRAMQLDKSSIANAIVQDEDVARILDLDDIRSLLS